jgi:hypothetical protein
MKIRIVLKSGTVEKTVKSEAKGLEYLYHLRVNKGLWVVSYKIEKE